MNNLYKDLKRKFNDQSLEKLNLVKECKEKLEIEEEKSDILKRQIKDFENILTMKNQNIKNLTESNKNLLSEVRVINASNYDYKITNENKNSELDFTKKELEKYNRRQKEKYS